MRHPWFGQEVWVHQTRGGPRSSGSVGRCGLTADLDAMCFEIPLWMFDAAACGVTPLTTAPVVSTDAIVNSPFSWRPPTTPRAAFCSKLSTST